MDQNKLKRRTIKLSVTFILFLISLFVSNIILNRGNTDTFEEMFGYSAATGKTRPTNSEYIARIADKIRLDYKAM